MEPVPEQYAGRNHPYRGTQDHGVSPTVEALSPPSHEETAIEWEADEPPVEPIPVKIVKASRDEIVDWRGTTIPLINGGQSVLVANRLATRQDLNIINDGPDDVYLSPDPISSANVASVRLAVNGSFSTKAVTEVYAFVESGKTATVRVNWEFVVKQ